MATLFDVPLSKLIDEPGLDNVSPDVEALVIRMTNLFFSVAGRVPKPAVLKALSTGSDGALFAEFAKLFIAAGARSKEHRNTNSDAILAGRFAIANLVAQTGGLLRSDEAQRMLRVSRTALQQWRDGSRVLALPLGDGSFGYPVAQFAPPSSDLEPPRPYAGIPEVLAAAGSALTSAELFTLLATDQVALCDESGQVCTGFEAIAAGSSEAVVALVQHVATPDDAGAPAA